MLPQLSQECVGHPYCGRTHEQGPSTALHCPERGQALPLGDLCMAINCCPCHPERKHEPRAGTSCCPCSPGACRPLALLRDMGTSAGHYPCCPGSGWASATTGRPGSRSQSLLPLSWGCISSTAVERPTGGLQQLSEPNWKHTPATIPAYPISRGQWPTHWGN